MTVLGNERARPKVIANVEVPPFSRSVESKEPTPNADPRARFNIATTRTEVWCIQDHMDPKVSSSSTAEKVRVLPRIFSTGAAPDVVVAIGTASYPSPETCDGCVVVGTKVFVHNPYPEKPNPQSDWTDERVGHLLPSSAPPGLFRGIDQIRSAVEERLLIPPLRPAPDRIVLAAYNHMALSVVNVTNYDDYAWTDPQGVQAVVEADTRCPLASVETTHGVVRMQSEAPFLFISGIANRLGKFNGDVAPREYAQNFVAAHNASIAAAWLAVIIADSLRGA
jgi:hypothetical protein